MMYVTGVPLVGETGLLDVQEYSSAPVAEIDIVLPIQSPGGKVVLIIGFALTSTIISLVFVPHIFDAEA